MLHDVPLSLKLLTEYLTELNLSSNQLKELPDFLGECSKLIYLNVAVNVLSSLPEGLGTLPYLRELVISNNRYCSVQLFKFVSCKLILC